MFVTSEASRGSLLLKVESASGLADILGYSPLVDAKYRVIMFRALSLRSEDRFSFALGTKELTSDSVRTNVPIMLGTM